MPLTSASLKAELGQRLGPYAPLANLDSVSAWAMREMGFGTAAPLVASDDDLLAVQACDFNELIDIAEYGAAERIYGNLEGVQLRAAGIDDDPEKLRRMWREHINHLLANLKQRYGYGFATLREGQINLGIVGGRRDGGTERGDSFANEW